MTTRFSLIVEAVDTDAMYKRERYGLYDDINARKIRAAGHD